MSRLNLPVLAAGVFVVALGYGVVLPIMPLLVERIAGASDPDVAWHTGALTGSYMLAIFLGAPLWGALSDRVGHRPVLLAGLLGYVLMLAAFAFARSVGPAYVARVLAGATAAAVLPVASASVAEIAEGSARARSYAVLGAATLFGYLVGPALSGAIYRLARAMDGSASMTANMAVWPLLFTAALGLLVLVAAFACLRAPPVDRPRSRANSTAESTCSANRLVLPTLNFLVTLGLGAFEVALPLAGRATLGLDPERIGVLFIECSLMMLAVQGLLFAAPLLTEERSRQLLAAGFAAMGIGFALLGMWFEFSWILIAVGFIAGGSGLLLPTVSFIASSRATASIGATLGVLAAAGSLGQAVGSAAGAWLFRGFSEATFWLAGAAMIAGAYASSVRPLAPATAAASVGHLTARDARRPSETNHGT